jgi:hypothetical protein
MPPTVLPVLRSMGPQSTQRRALSQSPTSKRKAAEGTENQTPSQAEGSPEKKARRTTRTVQQTLMFRPNIPVLPLGLVRVKNEDAPLSENPEVIALQAGSTLGRHEIRPKPTYVNLGINKDNGMFVSRGHILVLEAFSSHLILEQKKDAVNNMFYRRKNSSKHQPMKSNEKVKLVEGDYLIFRPSNSTDRNGKVVTNEITIQPHVFLVYPMGTAPTTKKAPTAGASSMPTKTYPVAASMPQRATAKARPSIPEKQTRRSKSPEKAKAQSVATGRPKRAAAAPRQARPSIPEKQTHRSISPEKAKAQSVATGRPKRATAAPRSSTPEDRKVRSRSPEESKQQPMVHVETDKLQRKKASKRLKPKASQVPKVDDRFRVYFDECRDFWGERKQAAGWFFGTVTEVKKKGSGYTLKIHTDDTEAGETVSMDWRGKDKIELVEEVGDLVVVSGTDAIASWPATHAELGDLVVAPYRHEENLKGCWFRGRVAQLQKGSCDIAYDDCDYEVGIPLQLVRIIEKGKDNPQWLETLTVGSSMGSSKIQSVNKTTGKVKFSRGKMEDYDKVVEHLCETLKERAPKKSRLPDTTESPLSTAISSPAMSGPDSQATKPWESYETSPVLVVPTREVWKPAWTAIEDESGPWRKPLPEDPIRQVKKYQDMHPSVWNTFWAALNSAEPHFGSSMLTMMTSAHHKVPGERMCKNLVDVLTYGPKAGDDSFPDCNRMTLAKDYFKLVLRQKGMARTMSEAVGSTYWKDCLESLSTLTYCAVDDESRTSEAAQLRIGQSLHLQACATEVLESLMQGMRQQDGYNHRSLPLFRDMIIDGISPAIKLAINVMVDIWVRHGHYLVGMEDDDSSEALQLTSTVTERVVQNLGRVVSIMLWLWAKEEGQSVTKSGFQIRDAVDHHIQQAPPADKKHWQKIKLNMILSLDENLVPKLRSDLAGLLGVSKMFKTVCVDIA